MSNFGITVCELNDNPYKERVRHNELKSKLQAIDKKAGLAERKIIYLNIAIESDNHMSTETRAQLKAIVHDYDREMKELRKLVTELI